MGWGVVALQQDDGAAAVDGSAGHASALIGWQVGEPPRRG